MLPSVQTPHLFVCTLTLGPSPDSKEEAKGRWDGLGAMRGCDVTAAPGERLSPHTDRSTSGLSVSDIFLIGLSYQLSRCI